MTGVALLDTADPVATSALLRPCCASQAWIARVIADGPFADLAALIAASDRALTEITWPDVLEALAAHPRIGERPAGTDREAAWSRQEQAGATAVADDTARALAEGNFAYQDRFGFVFLICATGMPAEAILAELNRRLGHDPDAEQEIVRTELGKIVRLRLGKLFG